MSRLFYFAASIFFIAVLSIAHAQEPIKVKDLQCAYGWESCDQTTKISAESASGGETASDATDPKNDKSKEKTVTFNLKGANQLGKAADIKPNIQNIIDAAQKKNPEQVISEIAKIRKGNEAFRTSFDQLDNAGGEFEIMQVVDGMSDSDPNKSEIAKAIEEGRKAFKTGEIRYAGKANYASKKVKSVAKSEEAKAAAAPAHEGPSEAQEARVAAIKECNSRSDRSGIAVPEKIDGEYVVTCEIKGETTECSNKKDGYFSRPVDTEKGLYCETVSQTTPLRIRQKMRAQVTISPEKAKYISAIVQAKCAKGEKELNSYDEKYLKEWAQATQKRENEFTFMGKKYHTHGGKNAGIRVKIDSSKCFYRSSPTTIRPIDYR